ncbi:MAG: hypothetical protein IPL09_02130 [Bacteroidetes bacterium]|nr:hypothetical protein [Bacteroidota bacterium]
MVKLLIPLFTGDHEEPLLIEIKTPALWVLAKKLLPIFTKDDTGLFPMPVFAAFHVLP